MKLLLLHSKEIRALILITIVLPSIAFAQWSAPVNISPNAVNAGTNESMGSCIGVSGDTVHVVWSDQRTSSRVVIYYTRSVNAGLTWSNAVAITDTNGSAWNPAIAVNGSSVHVVWRNIVNNVRSSYYKHSLNGGNTWGPNVMLDSAVADWPAVAVSGNTVYVANDIVTSASPYNTEIFFLRSLDNGLTWSTHQQVTFSTGRSEDEAIIAEGPHVFMSWNDNRNGGMQILYKHSADYGVTWGNDVVVNSEPSYSTMVSVNGAYVDVPSAGAPTGHYQIHLNQSADTGATWGADRNLTNDTAHTYYYPYMVRNGSDLHVTYVKSGVGGQYLHSANGGTTWDAPYNMGYSGITPFIAYTGCVLHVIMPDSGHIIYIRNPTGNAPPLLNLKFFIQGYYLAGGTMQKVLHNEGVDANPNSTNVDTVVVELHSAMNTATVVASYKGVLQTNGTLACTFPCFVFANSYYIVVKHRNITQTWSVAPVKLSEITNYDFTTSSSKAFGNNMKQVQAGVWAFFSGDINQDDNIDLLDFPSLDSGISHGLTGYYNSDLNGDGNVDLLDFPMLDANINAGVYAVHP